MSLQNARYSVAKPHSTAPGWSLTRLNQPSRLFGANGLRTGPDGRIYVAQVAGSQISALDVATGQVEVISAQGGDVIAPDDIAFDARGDLYVTEYYDGRVSVRSKDGSTRVLRDDVPGANGITFHKGRLFIDECRIGGRVLELDLNGGAPRVLLENLPMPNAMEVGPDGKLYYPMIGSNDIWRVDLDGGTPERVVGDCGAPVAVKFDSKGFIVSPQVASGQVLRIDPRNGERTVLAQLDPGVDNLTFVGERLFVSHFTGQIVEILGGGKTQSVLPRGLSWPLDLTVGRDGKVYVCDGHHFFAVQPGGELQTVGMLFSPGYPGNVRGVVAVSDGEFIITTSLGQVSRYRPAQNESEVLAQGLDQLYGVAVGPNGALVVAELGAGRVLSVRAGDVEALATGLDKPLGVAIGPDNTVYVSESGGGRVVKLSGSKVETVVDGLKQPQGIVVRDGQLYVVDAGANAVIAFDMKTKTRETIARDLPVGPPPGVSLKPLRGLQPFTGPQGPFAGIAAAPDGTLYVSGDAEGSVLVLRKGDAHRN
jgi:sugar lactone lactonase YvrE